MAYLVTTAGAHGRRLIFKKENGELYYAAEGKEFSGTLVFQTVDGTNNKRIFFGDTVKALTGAAKKLFGLSNKNLLKAYNASQKDNLCCFEFKDSDILDGRKKIEICTDFMVGPFLVCTRITCYDSVSKTGCMYILPSEVMEEWNNILEPYLRTIE